MCLYITEPKLRRADNDITCYKVLLELLPGHYYTPSLMERVHPDGKSCCQYAHGDISVAEEGNLFSISNGMVHVYKNLCDAVKDCDSQAVIHKGKGGLRARWHVYECVIPKVTLYCDGLYDLSTNLGSYASRKISYVRCVHSAGEFDMSETDDIRLIRCALRESFYKNWDAELILGLMKHLNYNEDTDRSYFEWKVFDEIKAVYKTVKGMYGVDAVDDPWLSFVLTAFDRRLSPRDYLLCSIAVRLFYHDDTLEQCDKVSVLERIFSDGDVRGITWEELKDTDSYETCMISSSVGIERITAVLKTPYEYFIYMFGSEHYVLNGYERMLVDCMYEVIVEKVLNKKIR